MTGRVEGKTARGDCAACCALCFAGLHTAAAGRSWSGEGTAAARVADSRRYRNLLYHHSDHRLVAWHAPSRSGSQQAAAAQHHSSSDSMTNAAAVGSGSAEQLPGLPGGSGEPRTSMADQVRGLVASRAEGTAQGGSCGGRSRRRARASMRVRTINGNRRLPSPLLLSFRRSIAAAS